MRTATLTLGVLAALALAGGAVRAGSVEDDLAVVKKAVAPKAQASGAPSTAGRASPEKPKPATDAAGTESVRRKGGDPQWLRVRVAEKQGKMVSVNLPLSLVRALGDDWPVDLGGRSCRGENGRRLTIGEVLRTLDSGQDLVQIDDEDATVRVWVE
jgi:hypothetical protein